MVEDGEAHEWTAASYKYMQAYSKVKMNGFGQWNKTHSHRFNPVMSIVEHVGLLLALGQAPRLQDPAHHDLHS